MYHFAYASVLTLAAYGPNEYYTYKDQSVGRTTLSPNLGKALCWFSTMPWVPSSAGIMLGHANHSTNVCEISVNYTSMYPFNTECDACEVALKTILQLVAVSR